MKKSMLITLTVLTTLGLAAIGFANWNSNEKNQALAPCNATISMNSDSEQEFNGDPVVELMYNLGSKFDATVSKEKLYKATTVIDILPAETDWASYPIQFLTVTVFRGETEKSALGNNVNLNAAQQQLLRTLDYSDSFEFNAPCKGKHKNVDRETYELNYKFTVTPEKQTKYSGGADGLIKYIKENSREQIANVIVDQLNYAAVSFTLSKTGTVSNVQLASSSGFPALDEAMIKLINNLPGTWEAAENSKGEKVEQELYFSYGRGGC